MKRRYYLKGLVRGVGLGMVLTALLMGMAMEAGKPMTDAEVKAKALQLGMVDPDSINLSQAGAVPGGTPASPPAGAGGELSPSPSPDPSPSASPGMTEAPGEGGDEGAAESPSPVSSPGMTEAPGEGGDEGAAKSLSPVSSPGMTEAPGEGGDEGAAKSPSPVSSPGTAEAPGEGGDAPGQSPEISAPGPSQLPEDGETVTIVIVKGDNSYTVSRRLQEAGLIENAREFDAYLVENGYSKMIRTGTYRIPLDATWQEIAELIA